VEKEQADHEHGASMQHRPAVDPGEVQGKPLPHCAGHARHVWSELLATTVEPVRSIT
jgi:hypothetical protein